MFIELAEFLRCPEGHPGRTYCVVAPSETVGRDVRRGTIGCPVCAREYAIVDGVARFGASGITDVGPWTVCDAEVVQALLGLSGPGGYVVLVGSAGHLAAALADRLQDVHCVTVNAPPEVTAGSTRSLIQAAACIPLATSMARGVVVGTESAREPWLVESARLLLRGLRVVVAAEDVTVPDTERLAAGDGLWVGRKR